MKDLRLNKESHEGSTHLRIALTLTSFLIIFALCPNRQVLTVSGALKDEGETQMINTVRALPTQDGIECERLKYIVILTTSYTEQSKLYLRDSLVELLSAWNLDMEYA